MYAEPGTARVVVAATLLLSGVWAAVYSDGLAPRRAQAAPEAFTIPLPDDGSAPVPAEPADSRPAASDPAVADQAAPRGAGPSEPAPVGAGPETSVPPPPLLTEPEAETAGPPAASGTAVPEAATPETAPSTATATDEPSTTDPPAADVGAMEPATAPAGSATSQAASRGDDDIEAVLRKLMADDSVVAIVDGKAILWGEVWRSAEELPSDYRGQPELLFPALLRRAVDMILLTNAARRDDLHHDPAIRRQVANYEERLLREQLLQRQIEAAVTDDALQELYYQHIQRQAAAVEVTARHIQLDSEDAALAVIAALDQGADFADLARERSQAASGKQGGSLGSFRLDRMPASFAAAIAKLQPGAYSQEPAKSEFGWHVIKLERRDGAALPSFAELAPQLRQEAERKAINDLLQELRSRASIELMPVAAGEQTSE